MRDSRGSPVRVLIVDDSDADLRIMSEMLKATAPRVQVYTAPDGLQAMEFLRRQDVPRPHVVLLDINMPMMSGHEVLCKIKNDDALRPTVVLMFSSSESPDDLKRAYHCHANGYLKKPNTLDEYGNLANTVVEFWGRLNKAPHS